MMQTPRMPLAFRVSSGVVVPAAVSIFLALAAGPAAAHAPAGTGSGFAAGFLHPFNGGDHLLAMVAVGLWAALIGGRAVGSLLVLFPLAMAAGAAVAMAGIGLHAVQAAIAVSVIVLGLAIALAVRPAARVAAGMVAVFAVFHGHAHGSELPAAVDAFSYAAGFLLATILLHLAGAGAGLLGRQGRATMLARLAGAVIAAAGVAFLPGA